MGTSFSVPFGANSYFSASPTVTNTSTAAGDDTVTGSTGNETLQGYSGVDYIYGGAGDDFLYGDTKSGASVSTSDGGDYLFGGDGNDSLDGGFGNDVLYGETGNDTLFGNHGRDTLYGGTGNDILFGGLESSSLYGGDGDDSLTGSSGADYLLGGTGSNVVNGGGGFDTTSYFGNSAVDVDLFAGTAHLRTAGVFFSDRLSSIEAVGGTIGDDLLAGDNSDNELSGNGGADVLTGGGGNDTLLGGSGSATVVYHGDRANYSIAQFLGGDVQITDNRSAAQIAADGGPYGVSDGVDTARWVQNFQFRDVTLSRVDLGLDDYGDHLDAVDLGVLTVGETRVGTIGIAFDNDAFSVELTGGVQYTFSVGAARQGLGTLPYQWMDIYGPGKYAEGIDVVNGRNTTDVTSVVAPTISGTYYVVVSGDYDETGTYTVSVKPDVADQLLTGGGGHNLLVGGDGNDTILGRAGNDTLAGQLGDDRLLGGSGHDVLFGGGGDDSLFGGDGDDRLCGKGGNDLMIGGAGVDRALYVGNADITLRLAFTGWQNTSQGIDRLLEIENVATSGGRDLLVGTGGNNWLSGQGNDDRLVGAGGDDTLLGGAGSDRLRGDAGDDVLNGGAGTDRAFFVGPNDTRVRLSLAEAQDTGHGTDRLIGIEDVLTGRGADLLVGSSGHNLLGAGRGSDTLIGGQGDDTLLGGFGDDILRGDAGDDVFDGGAGTDTALFTGSADTSVRLFVGAAQATGFGMDRFVSIENVTTAGGDDLVVGNAGANLLVAGAGSDTLAGGANSDTLLGGDGDDVLRGDAGNDLLWGNGGSDIFIYRDGDGADRVSDFRDDVDTLLLDVGLWGGGKSVNEVIATYGTLSGRDAVFDFSGGDTLTLRNVASLSALADDIGLI